MPVNRSRLLALSDKEFRRETDAPAPKPRDSKFRPLRLNISKFDGVWDRKRGSAARLMAVPPSRERYTAHAESLRIVRFRENLWQSGRLAKAASLAYPSHRAALLHNYACSQDAVPRGRPPTGCSTTRCVAAASACWWIGCTGWVSAPVAGTTRRAAKEARHGSRDFVSREECDELLRGLSTHQFAGQTLPLSDLRSTCASRNRASSLLRSCCDDCCADS
jgi:hypothetical protein